jgi:hypothetical protein
MVLDRALESTFLRIYAKNLIRSYRSEPENACSDAEIQMSTMLLMTIFIVFLLAGALLFPSFLNVYFKGGDLMYGPMIVVALGVIFGVHKRFGRYERMPELARGYATKTNSRWSLVAFWSIMLLAFAVIWLVLGPRHL